jgi:hypothetical protein
MARGCRSAAGRSLPRHRPAERLARDRALAAGRLALQRSGGPFPATGLRRSAHLRCVTERERLRQSAPVSRTWTAAPFEIVAEIDRVERLARGQVFARRSRGLSLVPALVAHCCVQALDELVFGPAVDWRALVDCGVDGHSCPGSRFRHLPHMGYKLSCVFVQWISLCRKIRSRFSTSSMKQP